MSVRHVALSARGPRYTLCLLGLLVLAVLGIAAAAYMDHHGHHVTGMTNRVVWGLPHVLAVYLILAASGALNVASRASVFGRRLYEPLVRLSVTSAIALLLGGLSVLVLDLGRPERLLIAMTHYNFSSVFAWNVVLYSGFIAIGAAYLWSAMERRMNRYTRALGSLALVWRVLLSTGTGCIFVFLVAQEAYHSVLIIPLFLAISLSAGLATFSLVLIAASRGAGMRPSTPVLHALASELKIWVIAVMGFVVIHHLGNVYLYGHLVLERYLLLDGGVYTVMFWSLQTVLGTLAPLALLHAPRAGALEQRLAAACTLVVLGTLAELYVIIIGGQAFPRDTFPGFEVVNKGFLDGLVAHYRPSAPEVLLGIGGVALALALITVAVRVLRLIPQPGELQSEL